LNRIPFGETLKDMRLTIALAQLAIAEFALLLLTKWLILGHAVAWTLAAGCIVFVIESLLLCVGFGITPTKRIAQK
jgi:hypothetical protein